MPSFIHPRGINRWLVEMMAQHRDLMLGNPEAFFGFLAREGLLAEEGKYGQVSDVTAINLMVPLEM